MSEHDSATPGPAAAKRPRPVISCLECRRKKLKCSRTHPCLQCVKIGRPGRCEFQAGQEPEPNLEYSASYALPNKRQRFLPPAANDENEPSIDVLAIGGQKTAVAKPGVVEDLQERVTRLEHALLSQARESNGETIPRSASSSRTRSSYGGDHSQLPDRVTQVSSQFTDACTFLTRLQHGPRNQQILDLRTDLRNLHYSVETNHQIQHVRVMEASATTNHPIQLPPLDVCEKLAVLYFDNMEHCFRILHWPDFRDQLSTLFREGEHACKFAFIPQLVGALTIAVLLGTHRECEAAAACSTIKPAEAIHFMQRFIAGLRHNERYRLPALQVKMLVLICRWLVPDPFEDLIRLSGELLRDALVMRMDREPTILPDISVFEGELRRKCWMTIVEVDLMLSILCKMPCMVPPYSSRPPRNLNDEEISEGMESLPDSRSTTDWTDGLCQYLLAQTFPRRVAACSQLDKPGNITAEDILPHIRYLERVLQDLPPPMRFNYLGDEASKTPARLMARMELDISIRRPLMHLYLRGVLSLDVKTAQRELQPGFLQSCLMLSNYQDLFDPHYSELDVPRPRGYWDFFYSCYRQELGQAILGLCLGIKNVSLALLTDSATSTHSAASPSIPGNPIAKGPKYTRETLINAAQDSLEPMRRRLPYRASKVKDIVYYETLLTSLLPEQPGEAKEATMIRKLQSLIRECQTELEGAHVATLIAPVHQSQPGDRNDNLTRNITSFDPLWEDFPAIDIFEPLEFATP